MPSPVPAVNPLAPLPADFRPLLEASFREAAKAADVGWERVKGQPWAKMRRGFEAPTPGKVATYLGLVLLAAIGGMMIRNSFRDSSERRFDATRGVGLVMTSLSISLDSLGVGMALPTVAVPLLPLLITVSMEPRWRSRWFGRFRLEPYEHDDDSEKEDGGHHVKATIERPGHCLQPSDDESEQGGRCG